MLELSSRHLLLQRGPSVVVQRHFASLTSPKRKRGNTLRQIPRLCFGLVNSNTRRSGAVQIVKRIENGYRKIGDGVMVRVVKGIDFEPGIGYNQ